MSQYDRDIDALLDDYLEPKIKLRIFGTDDEEEEHRQVEADFTKGDFDDYR